MDQTRLFCEVSYLFRRYMAEVGRKTPNNQSIRGISLSLCDPPPPIDLVYLVNVGCIAYHYIKMCDVWC